MQSQLTSASATRKTDSYPKNCHCSNLPWWPRHTQKSIKTTTRLLWATLCQSHLNNQMLHFWQTIMEFIDIQMPAQNHLLTTSNQWPIDIKGLGHQHAHQLSPQQPQTHGWLPQVCQDHGTGTQPQINISRNAQIFNTSTSQQSSFLQPKILLSSSSSGQYRWGTCKGYPLLL